MYMYIMLGQNYHNLNVSSMPKSTTCELSVESLSKNFLSANNWVGTCPPRQIRLTPVPSSVEIFIPKQGRCYLIRTEHGTNLVPGGRPG